MSSPSGLKETPFVHAKCFSGVILVIKMLLTVTASVGFAKKEGKKR